MQILKQKVRFNAGEAAGPPKMMGLGSGNDHVSDKLK
jgi:hypothetical protein